ncbi:MAG TPA: protein-methionine-sulfoxide reductase heme-binding subunit MsrQ [Ideonella sp.]|jgi:sulfoxide reductase heme-binding subunit YedZ|nr:protein-methionine-sulfoxide reductase heme-binding subunit MsrQ [Ideonella sp.]
MADATIVNRLLAHRAAKPVLWTLLALPLAWLVWRAFNNQLGANPAEALIRSLGDWTLRGLCLTLAITPLRAWTGWHQLLRHRRAIGVATFCYATMHWLSYAWLDQGLVWNDLVTDVAKRPFILVGTTAWLLLLPLAATSFNRAIKALGAKRWQALHKAIYAIALLAILHFFWMRSGKHLYGEVAIYASIIAVLLGWRVRNAWRQRAASGAPRQIATNPR